MYLILLTPPQQPTQSTVMSLRRLDSRGYSLPVSPTGCGRREGRDCVSISVAQHPAQ